MAHYFELLIKNKTSTDSKGSLKLFIYNKNIMKSLFELIEKEFCKNISTVSKRTLELFNINRIDYGFFIENVRRSFFELLTDYVRYNNLLFSLKHKLRTLIFFYLK